MRLALRGADSSAFIASITCSVEIWFIGTPVWSGRNSVSGALWPACKMIADAKRGRQ